MKKILFMLACLFASSVAMAEPKPFATTTQTHCDMPEVGTNLPCVVVVIPLIGTNPTVTSTISTAPAYLLKGKVKTFSVVYGYQVIRGPNRTVGLSANRGNHGLLIDVDMNKPTLVWTTTHDGGQTWSKLFTQDMGGAVPF